MKSTLQMSKPIRPYLMLVTLALVTVGGGREAAAQPQGAVTVAGQVLNGTNNQYLNRARITVKGTTIETFTDEQGAFRLSNVPPGEVVITAFFTGLEPATASIRASAGATVRQDFTLSRGDTGKGSATVVLDEFVVATNRELNAQSIAINEQRFSPNIKNVVSTDEFGDIGESNLGEFIKLMPGVTVNYSVGVFANDIQVRGFPSNTTSVNVDGAEAAHAGNGFANRQTSLNSLQTLNNVARVEVSKTPTPDMPAHMLGGSVNVITKTAFERTKPLFTYRTAATWNSRMPLGTQASGVGEERVSTIRPAVDFGYIVPVSKTFGFTLSGGYNSRFFNVDTSTSSWDIVNLRTTGHSLTSSSQMRDAGSGGITADWKPGEDHVLSGSLSYSNYRAIAPTIQNSEALGANPTGDATFAQSNGAIASATIAMSSAYQTDETWQGSVKYRYTGRVLKVDSSAFYSTATHKRRVSDHGSFSNASAVLPNIIIRYDEIGSRGSPGPGVISARTAAGAPVDVTDVRNFQLRTLSEARVSSYGEKSGAQLNLKREFDLGYPVDLKTGVYINREKRDLWTSPRSLTFLGPDKVANNADNIVGLYDFVAREVSSEKRPDGFAPGTFLSSHKVYDYYLTHPDQFTVNEVAAITGRANGSPTITETVSAAYVRADARLWSNRLWLVGGVRFERTADEGRGVLNDVRATFRQDASGNILRDAAGRPIPVTTDAVAAARLQFKERGTFAKRSYSDWYPSFNATYNVTDNVLLRVAYARTIGRPNYTTIVPGITASSPDAASPTITVNNTGLKPWSANAYDLSLETYLGNNGVASVGLFRKDIRDFFGTVATPATLELLTEYGLTDEYLDYTIRTTFNTRENARISGIELNYRQALTFLPAWARGVQIFANCTFLDLDGSRDADFNNFATRTLNYGISLTRPRYSVKLNWNSNGDIRANLVAASATIPPDTYFYITHRTTLDASFEVRVHKNWGIYGTARNLTDRRVRRDRYGPTTPSYAVFERYLDVGAYISLGVKGEF